MILEFTETPQANKGGELQDTFELFKVLPSAVRIWNHRKS